MKNSPWQARELWINALRSNDYIQQTNALERIGPDNVRRNCCFGVACRLFLQEEGDLIDIIKLEDGTIAFNENVSVPPTSVMLWLDLYMLDVAKLILMNDLEKKSFPEIADYIESNWE